MMRRSTLNSLSSVPEGDISEGDDSQEDDEDEIYAFAKHLGMDPNQDMVRRHSQPSSSLLSLVLEHLKSYFSLSTCFL